MSSGGSKHEASSDVLPLSLVVVTYRRERVLLDTLKFLIDLSPRADEIIVVDQTEIHDVETSRQLLQWSNAGIINLRQMSLPSIPIAMNEGLLAARNEIVVFVDDDVIPDRELVLAHYRAQIQFRGIVAGQVMQPGEQPVKLNPNQTFCYNSIDKARVSEFIGCNFSVWRKLAIDLGGFDENFEGAAYRYEAEFASRYIRKFGLFCFEPSASLRHLRASAGGTRTNGTHLRTAKPNHSVGEYYFLARTKPRHWLMRAFRRVVGSVATRHHLANPWWIPITLTAEMRGIWRAYVLYRRGPIYIGSRETSYRVSGTN